MLYQDKNTRVADEIWRQAIIPEKSNIRQAISNLDQFALKIVLVVDKNNKLIGTVSDGDIRRGLLKGFNLDSPIVSVVHHDVLVVPPDMEHDMVMQLMVFNKINKIPVVDEQLQILGLHMCDGISKVLERPNLMVIMAGGKGTRLLPHTQNCPKPMVLVKGKPMLEHIIERGKRQGFNHFILAIHHLGNIIESYFENGDRFGVKIDYLREQSPLGTAGALSLLNPKPEMPFVVTNCDIITDISYGDLLDFHNRHSAVATMAVRLHEWQHPYGVVHTDGVDIIGFEEKPIARSHINAGVYVLEPSTLDVITEGEYCDMPTLFCRLQESKRTIVYPMHEPWLDVGLPDDLLQANNFTTKVQK